ncbi:MBOAT family O-acyltransferase [Deltaproteobacteria bacterium TL4]
MVFSSEIFLFLFLPGFLLVYYGAPSRLKNVTALMGSLVFYVWGAPTFIVLILISNSVDYVLSQKIELHQKNVFSKVYLTLGILLNAGVLLYFKYSNFLVEEINTVLNNLGFNALPWTSIALPIGISFLTFQKISYLLDVYRQTTAPAKTLVDYMLYVLFFPQLIAGPIVRYHDISTQLHERSHRLEDVLEGAFRFTMGLAKKILIADSLGYVADQIFGMEVSSIPTHYAWLGIMAYTYQIYFDFSGYSDMAIGLARMMGFGLLENFNYPYLAANISDFWRRWHISLSRWMKEYLYLSLGGNRKGSSRTYVNLWLVFVVSGLWHGANWTFLLWGIYHGFFLVMDKLFWLKLSKRLPKVLNIGITFFIVMLGWVIFRSENVLFSWEYLKILMGQSPTTSSNLLLVEIINNRAKLVLSLAMGFSWIPLTWFGEQIKNRLQEAQVLLVIKGWLAVILLFLSTSTLVNSSFHPFIYFRF